MKLLRTSTQVLAAVGSMAGVWWTVAQEAPLSGTDATTLRSDQAGPQAAAADGPAYEITAFDFVMLRDLPGLPTQDDLNNIVVEFLETPTGYVAPRPGSANTPVRLGDLNTLPLDTLHASAANHVAAAVVRDFNDRGIIGVLVSPDPNEIRVDFTDQGTAVWGGDLRADGNTTLRLLVRTNVVSEMRTVASGDRITDGQRVNHPNHRRILANSPVGVGDLVNRRQIDDYLFDLNRHPGRNAAVAVSTGLNPAQGDTVLDYLVSEAKPWTAFFNLSNTGTADTRVWRERFGYLDTQFTGNDDIFSIEYVTAGFEESHALFISYERPFESNDRLHWRTYGTFQDFTASDVGAPGADFDGTEYGIGGELIWNFWQKGPSFLDLVGGARWESVYVDNQFAAIEETEPFFVPYLGVAFENTTQVNTTTAYLGVEFNLDGVAGTDSPDIDGLGRLNTDADWVKFPFSLTHSFYLEPIFNRDDWLNISTPGSTLAHELFFAFRGQYVPDSRLNPQAQEVLGGLYTVRGYDEAITAGDTVLIATAEYRLHIPRLFTPTPGQQRPVTQMFGEPFRTFPQEPYGSADWDLVAKAFIDAGRSLNNDRLFFEQNETLVGAGVGVDLLFKRNANFRIDYGVALEDAAGTTAGSSQFHFSFTLLY
ncbi:ShlB/FhaC/HecB family hemolysin secretion/activation protein [Algisphaera agarilytica]|uniref:Hemolysin activation/secretion protein n=1 Tax=Algisphaera agarilytica TaxID=1385975 RepID=A0A7X0H6U2_9BACT|nr:ShlB/FhaC/HecB family hemolysin secretion/activation protein [Algisphaera agarilytica]MBB6430183.1 hypothetical protein [Algisphaera agarilytica]